MRSTAVILASVQAIGLLLLVLVSAANSNIGVAVTRKGVTQPREEDSQTVLRAAELPIDESLRSARAVAPEAILKKPNGIAGIVIDEYDRAVPGVTVLICRGRERIECVTDVRGRYEFRSLADGKYRVLIEGQSLPNGLLPPRQQNYFRAPVSPPTGSFGTVLTLSDELETVDLRVVHAASVGGWVSKTDGSFVPGVVVRLRAEDGELREARADENGTFLIKGVYPGRYIGEVPSMAVESSDAVGAALEISAGESSTLALVIDSV